jgi:hypothetical protein
MAARGGGLNDANDQSRRASHKFVARKNGSLAITLVIRRDRSHSFHQHIDHGGSSQEPQAARFEA